MTPGAALPLTRAQRDTLAAHLDAELSAALVAHTEVEQKLKRWDELYLAESVGRKTFPFDGACNITVPLIGTTVDSIVARIVNTIFSVEPFWTVRPLHKDFQEAAKPVENFLDWSRRVEFDLYGALKPWVIETVKYGWGWLKPRWEVSTQPYYRPGTDGRPVRDDRILRRATVDHVLCQDVVAQAGIGHEEQGEWIAHRIRLTDGQCRWRRAEKAWQLTEEDLEKILRSKEDTTTVEDLLQPDRPPRSTIPNTFYEVWGDFAVGADPKPVSLAIIFHKPTRTICKVIVNPDYYGQRPLLKGTFIQREGRPYGLGICQMLEPLQDELTTIHRQQVDNGTLANTRFYVAKRGQVKPNEKIWPGKVLRLADPKGDFAAFQMGDVYPSMRSLGVEVLAFAERRSGVSDPQLGRESTTLGSRATATGTLALIQEGNRRFDLNVRDMRDTLSKVGKAVLQLNQQFRPKGLAYFVQGDDGELVESVLDLPAEFLEHRLGVELTASTATINREVEKQGLIALMQLQQTYAQELLSYAQIVSNPQLPPELREMAVRVASARTTLMERVMHTFDQKDAEDLVPSLVVLEAANALPPDLGLAGAEGAPALPGPPDGGVPGGEVGPGMAARLGNGSIPSDVELAGPA